ncbi:MAG: beta-lactamase hydrolase domain-containing protein [Phycisphaeraceae bacterium]
MRNRLLLALLLVTLALTGCQADPSTTGAGTVEPTNCGDVKNMHRVGDLYVSGAVTPGDFPLLRGLGIETILNLRKKSETPDMDEAALAEAQGIAYVHVPWSGASEFTDERIDAMRGVLRDSARPMLFHCGSANRVAAGWLTYRVLDQGVDLETALSEAKTIGLRSEAYETKALAYIAQNR